MTTAVQDLAFLNDVIGASLLDASIDWISDNLKPEEVFTDADLAVWATDNGYIIPESA